jgi:hypothetical protein
LVCPEETPKMWVIVVWFVILFLKNSLFHFFFFSLPKAVPCKDDPVIPPHPVGIHLYDLKTGNDHRLSALRNDTQQQQQQQQHTRRRPSLTPLTIVDCPSPRLLSGSDPRCITPRATAVTCSTPRRVPSLLLPSLVVITTIPKSPSTLHAEGIASPTCHRSPETRHEKFWVDESQECAQSPMSPSEPLVRRRETFSPVSGGNGSGGSSSKFRVSRGLPPRSPVSPFL